MKYLKRHFAFVFLSLILILSLMSCKVTKELKPGSTEQEINSPEIAFFTFSLAYDSVQNEYSMALIDKKVVPGKIKESAGESFIHTENKLIYKLLNKNSEIISEKKIASPLERTVEYADDTGKLQKQTIRLDSAELFLRLSLPPEARFLSFEMEEKDVLIINLKN